MARGATARLCPLRGQYRARGLDEARRLEFRDVEIVDDEGSGETILEIEVRGKIRGFGYRKSLLSDAVESI